MVIKRTGYIVTSDAMTKMISGLMADVDFLIIEQKVGIAVKKDKIEVLIDTAIEKVNIVSYDEGTTKSVTTLTFNEFYNSKFDKNLYENVSDIYLDILLKTDSDVVKERVKERLATCVSI